MSAGQPFVPTRTLDLLRRALIGAWLGIVAVAAWIYIFHPEVLQNQLQGMFSASLLVGGSLYLLFSCIRGFTLIPVTILIVAGIPFIPPTPLFLFTLIGIAASAASIYFFSEVMGLDRLFEHKHKAQVDRVRDVLTRYEFPIILGWSCFPLVPTDLICYVAGTLRINFPRFLVAVIIGEGVTCALYIFGGDYLLRTFDLRL